MFLFKVNEVCVYSKGNRDEESRNKGNPTAPTPGTLTFALFVTLGSPRTSQARNNPAPALLILLTTLVSKLSRRCDWRRA